MIKGLSLLLTVGLVSGCAVPNGGGISPANMVWWDNGTSIRLVGTLGVFPGFGHPYPYSLTCSARGHVTLAARLGGEPRGRRPAQIVVRSGRTSETFTGKLESDAEGDYVAWLENLPLDDAILVAIQRKGIFQIGIDGRMLPRAARIPADVRARFFSACKDAR